MSAGYASRLSDYPNKGVCGLPETFDSKRALKVKLERLGKMVSKSKHLVILTGAGISTSAGIPDFRGPKGVWTLEDEKKKKNPKSKQKSRKRSRAEVTTETNTEGACSFDFSKAQPTLTHRAITCLAKKGVMKYCVTQNVDGLHRRSGLSRDQHASLHGCAFTEQCSTCKAEYFRDFDTGGLSFKPTGRKCEKDKCEGDLCDTLLDWEDAISDLDFETATMHFEKADLALCLGTSLRIEPVGSLPTFSKSFVIVNLQQTPKDDSASLIIRASVDDVLGGLMDQLGFEDWDTNGNVEIERIWNRK